MSLVPFHCSTHGHLVDAHVAAQVWCRCGKKGRVPEDQKEARDQALDARRKWRKRLARAS